jgi:hypothetical protein
MGLNNLFLLRLYENAMLWIITGSNEEEVMEEQTKLYGKLDNQHRFYMPIIITASTSRKNTWRTRVACM